MTDAPAPRPTRFRTGGLSQRKPTRVFWSPGADECQRLADELGLLALHRLAFSGQIDPIGRDEFRLQGQLIAQVDQACIVTLVPVPATIDAPVLRRYLAGLDVPQADEVEMPEDDSLEPMPEVLDIAEVAVEALMLALPLYPRAPGASFAAPEPANGDTDPADARNKPFANLADRLKLSPKNGGDGAE